MLVILVAFACGIIGASSKLPDGVEKCKFGDNICIKKQLDVILKNYSNGDESLPLVNLNPIEVQPIHLKQPQTSAVNIDLTLINCTIYGFQNATFVTPSGFGKDIKGPHTIQFSVPMLNLLGHYKVDGKVIVLPIRGAGDANLTATEPDIKFRFEGRPLEKDNKIYLDVVKMKTRVNLKRLYIDLTNLFNDKALSDNMNKFLNENWEDIWTELKGSITNELNDVILNNILKPAFSNNPYYELFLDE